MNDHSSFYFQSYEQWRHAITVRCKIHLTAEYARTRINALSDPTDLHTQEFSAKYGDAYLKQVIAWFTRAEQNA